MSKQEDHVVFGYAIADVRDGDLTTVVTGCGPRIVNDAIVQELTVLAQAEQLIVAGNHRPRDADGHGFGIAFAVVIRYGHPGDIGSGERIDVFCGKLACSRGDLDGFRRRAVAPTDSRGVRVTEVGI